MRIAFLYIMKAYQCYHAAVTALDFATRSGWTTVSYFNDREAPHHLERVRRGSAAPPVSVPPLKRSKLIATRSATVWLL